MNTIFETRFNDFIDSKSLTTNYKLIEFNSDESYIKISLLDKDLKLVKVIREIFQGVIPQNIGSIDKTIDVSKNIIMKK